ncbi:hypothetical protein [Streptomyces sp. NPDC021096]|uniref:hypothetical protein n=1 Tax=Streptomyces sp. NPDC021096 TaxID=3154792 RepID=UPI0033E37C6C
MLDDATQKRPVTPGMVITTLLVPLISVAGLVTSLSTDDIENEWVDRQREACRHMPFPKTEYAAAWAGLALGIATLFICVLLTKKVRRRYGARLGETWPPLVTYVGVQLCMWLTVLTMPVELIQLYAAYTSAGSGIVLGDCG